MTIENDFTSLKDVSVPAKRAAYSDRTAWIMATMAELAYREFGQEEEQNIVDLAKELASLTEQDDIVERLKALWLSFQKADNRENQVLKAALSVGGFALAGEGILYDDITDTQGFVAVRHDDAGPGMAIICFRGTKETKDWLTNLDATQLEIIASDPDSDEVIGKMHQGFHKAYKSVEGQIASHLEGHEDLPLFITGHSLGGALAVVATWYQSSEKLAACYTFGAPRVGDIGLMDRFKTPIYRVVNGADPIPFVPPSSEAIDLIRSLFELIAEFIPLVGRATVFFDRYKGYRHYGFMRYLSMAPEGPKDTYPKLKVEYSLSSIGRVFRYYKKFLVGEADRIDKYHNMIRYRHKLRAHAIRRNK